MQASLVLNVLVAFASSYLGGVPNVGEVLKDDGTARSGMLDKAFGEDVVMVFASPKLFAAQLLEMPLSRAAAFGLQFAFQTEGTSLPALSSGVHPRIDGWM